MLTFLASITNFPPAAWVWDNIEETLLCTWQTHFCLLALMDACFSIDIMLYLSMLWHRYMLSIVPWQLPDACLHCSVPAGYLTCWLSRLQLDLLRVCNCLNSCCRGCLYSPGAPSQCNLHARFSSTAYTVVLHWENPPVTDINTPVLATQWRPPHQQASPTTCNTTNQQQ